MRRVSITKKVKRVKSSKLNFSPRKQTLWMDGDRKNDKSVDGERRDSNSVEKLVTIPLDASKKSEELLPASPSFGSKISGGKKGVKRKISPVKKAKRNICAKVIVSPRKENSRLEVDWNSDEGEDVDGEVEFSLAPAENDELTPTPLVESTSLKRTIQGLLPVSPPP